MSKPLFNNDSILKEIELLSNTVEARGFADYDYYMLRDNFLELSYRLFRRKSPFIETFEIADRLLSLSAHPTIHQRLGSRSIQNPKTLILCALAFTKLAKMGFREYLPRAKRLASLLIQNHVKEYFKGGKYIGAPFKHWYDFSQSKLGFFPEGSPNVYLTSLFGKTLLELNFIDSSFDSLAFEVADFLMLPECSVKIENSVFFRYFLGNDDLLVHNANTSCASFLIALSSMFGPKSQRLAGFAEVGKNALRLSAGEIGTDGALTYFSKYDKRYSTRIIDNFHTGFVTCDLIDIFAFTQDPFFKFLALKCLKFYSTMFDEKGLPSYTPFKRFPIDIHDCAVGIITFAKASYIDKNYLRLAERICVTVMDQFLDKDGLFFFQKYPLKMHTGKFLRWNQSWMLLALAHMVAANKLT